MSPAGWQNFLHDYDRSTPGVWWGWGTWFHCLRSQFIRVPSKEALRPRHGPLVPPSNSGDNRILDCHLEGSLTHISSSEIREPPAEPQMGSCSFLGSADSQSGAAF